MKLCAQPGHPIGWKEGWASETKDLKEEFSVRQSGSNAMPTLPRGQLQATWLAPALLGVCCDMRV